MHGSRTGRMRAGIAPGALLAVCLVLAAPWPVGAGQPAPGAQRDIARLIARLGTSPCRFERNGRWYDAARAKAHLKRKYDWLRRRGMVDTVDQFIDRAASRSSFSGRAYHVRCPGEAEVEAATWFRLQRQRLDHPAAPTR